jgi:hypothetical protein
MNTSFGTDIQHSQTSLRQPPPSQLPSPSRPHSIAELAKLAKQSLGDDVRPFKAWLRFAENAVGDARSFNARGDLESAFVEYTKAAAIVFEKVPAHPDYRVLLSTTQRYNMGLVSYFYSLGPHTCASVGRVHAPYVYISVFLHGCHTLVMHATLIRSCHLKPSVNPLLVIIPLCNLDGGKLMPPSLSSASWNEYLLRSVYCQ